MVGGLVFLTPVGALLALGALVPLAALFVVRHRARRVRDRLGLVDPPFGQILVALSAVIVTGAALGLAAAQPVLERTTTLRTRTDAEVFVVLDISRSMLAQPDKSSPMRIERAKRFAGALRSSLAEIPVGIASLTDRVLPHLFPSVDLDVFAVTLDRSLGIERPPPRSSLLTNATKLDALATIRTQRFYSPRAAKRLVVVLTDGESQPVSAARLADLFRTPPVIETVFVQFWGRDERVFAGNSPEALYRADPSARTFLDGLARSMGASVYDESKVLAVRQDVRKRLGQGPTVIRGEQGGRIALAPYLAAAAFAPLLLVLWRRDR